MDSSSISAHKTSDVAAHSSSPQSSSEGWKERIFYPTILAGIIGAGVGLISKYRKVQGLANISSTYAANFAIVAGCYCGSREFVQSTRKTGPDDLWNSAIGGFCSGALLGRLQGGQLGAMRYSVIFAAVGTAADYASMKLLPDLKAYIGSKSGKDLKLPEWSPIRVLDEDALAAKRAREQQLRAQRGIPIAKDEA